MTEAQTPIRFWFGPFQSDSFDLQLLPALLALGGLPFRVKGEQLTLSLDPPLLTRWKAIDPQAPVLPVLLLLPLERRLPAAWLARFRRSLALQNHLQTFVGRLPALAGLFGAWASEHPAGGELLRAAGLPASSCSWLGYAPEFCRPEQPVWDTLCLGLTPALAALRDRPRSYWTLAESNFDLLLQLRRCRVAIGGSPEALPFLLRALAAGAKAIALPGVLTPAGAATPFPAPLAGLFHCEAGQIESLLESLLERLPASQAPEPGLAGLAYRQVLAALVDALLAQAPATPSEAAVAKYAAVWHPQAPVQLLLAAFVQKRWPQALSLWQQLDPHSLLAGLPSRQLPLELALQLPRIQAQPRQAWAEMQIWLQANLLLAAGRMPEAAALLDQGLAQLEAPLLLGLARELAWHRGERARALGYQLRLAPHEADQIRYGLWEFRLEGLPLGRLLSRMRRDGPGLALQLPLLREALQNTSPAGIWWEGGFDNRHSLALVNNALSEALRACLPEPLHWLPSEPLARELPAPETLPRLLITHRAQLRKAPPAGTTWINIMPWEYGSVPLDWLPLRERAEQIWVPSASVRGCLWQAGFAPGRVRVVPNGIDPTRFRPEGERYPLATRASFRFLFVGGVLRRKGIDLLIEAYCSSFSALDDVCLVIKDWGSAGVYATEPERRRLLERLQAKQGPEILYLDGARELSDEELPALYRACDVYVQPYRGEGFGLPLLEAEACGLPVIVTDAGPGPEFCPPEAGWQVRSLPDFVPWLNLEGPGFSAMPWWHEPDPQDLARCLREAFEQRAALAPRRQAALAAAAGLHWERIAAALPAQLAALPIGGRRLPAPLRRRLAWGLPASYPLPRPQNPGWDWVGPAEAELLLLPAWQGPADRRHLWWLDHLPEPGRVCPPEACWLAADPAFAEALIERGVSPGRIGLLPASWDFAALPAKSQAGPAADFVVPQADRLDAAGLANLLRAWELAFGPAESQASPRLLLLGHQDPSPPARLCAPGLAPVRLQPDRPDLALLGAASGCLLLDDSPPLAWTLAAQALGCRLISHAQYHLLDRPWALSARRGDPDQLAWLLRKLEAGPQQALTVASELAARHDLHKVTGLLPEALLS